MQPVDFVLQRFNGDNVILADEVAVNAADAIEVWLCDGIEAAMSKFNGDVPRQAVSHSKPELKEQLTIYQRAHELAPSDAKALAKLVSFQKKLGQFDEAVSGHLRLAELYERQGESRQANAERV